MIIVVNGFSLTPAEQATPGVKWQRDRLVIRPTPPAFFASGMLMLVGGLIAVVGLVARGVGILLVVPASTLLAGGVRTAAASVIAEGNLITVRNHTNRKRVALRDVEGVQGVDRRFRWGKLPYSSPWNGPHNLTVGSSRCAPVMSSSATRRCACPRRRSATLRRQQRSRCRRWLAGSARGTRRNRVRRPGNDVLLASPGALTRSQGHDDWPPARDLGMRSSK